MCFIKRLLPLLLISYLLALPTSQAIGFSDSSYPIGKGYSVHNIGYDHITYRSPNGDGRFIISGKIYEYNVIDGTNLLVSYRDIRSKELFYSVINMDSHQVSSFKNLANFKRHCITNKLNRKSFPAKPTDIY